MHTLKCIETRVVENFKADQDPICESRLAMIGASDEPFFDIDVKVRYYLSDQCFQVGDMVQVQIVPGQSQGSCHALPTQEA